MGAKGLWGSKGRISMGRSAVALVRMDSGRRSATLRARSSSLGMPWGPAVGGMDSWWPKPGSAA